MRFLSFLALLLAAMTPAAASSAGAPAPPVNIDAQGLALRGYDRRIGVEACARRDREAASTELLERVRCEQRHVELALICRELIRIDPGKDVDRDRLLAQRT